MKTKEELIALKNEVDAQNKKLAELSEDELKQVVSAHGDFNPCPEPSPGNKDSRTVPVSSRICKKDKRCKHFGMLLLSALFHADFVHQVFFLPELDKHGLLRAVDSIGDTGGKDAA